MAVRPAIPAKWDDVITYVMRAHNVRRESLFSHMRKRKYVRARWEAWYMLKLSGWTYTAIAGGFDRDHTTVMHGVAEWSKLISGTGRLVTAIPDRRTRGA